METTIEHLQAALEASAGKFPEELLKAFLPERQTLFGQQLVPLTAGHFLALVNFNHPLACKGVTWTYEDIPLAMFIFTRPSGVIFDLIGNGTFEAEFFAFLETLPCEEMGGAIEQLVSHWMTANAPALAMKAPGSAQKKTADSDGGSPPSPAP